MYSRFAFPSMSNNRYSLSPSNILPIFFYLNPKGMKPLLIHKEHEDRNREFPTMSQRVTSRKSGLHNLIFSSSFHCSVLGLYTKFSTLQFLGDLSFFLNFFSSRVSAIHAIQCRCLFCSTLRS